MTGVTKFDNKYILELDPVLAARAKSIEDMKTLSRETTLEELRNLVARILVRLEALENR